MFLCDHHLFDLCLICSMVFDLFFVPDSLVQRSSGPLPKRQQPKRPAERSQRQPPSSTFPPTPLRSSRSSGSCCAHQATLAEVVDSFTTRCRYATLLHAGSAGLGSRGARKQHCLFSQMTHTSHDASAMVLPFNSPAIESP